MSNNEFISIKIKDLRYLVPLKKILTVPNLAKMASLLNTDVMLPNGEASIRIYEESEHFTGETIILKQFWPQIVRDGLRIIIKFENDDSFPYLPIDEVLKDYEGCSKKKDLNT